MGFSYNCIVQYKFFGGGYMQPTGQLYTALEHVFNHFNHTLFNDSLPSVIFTTQRQKNVLGYFSADRWVSGKNTHAHEIAINPEYIARSALIEMFQTIVHEQCHLWQHCYGKPGRGRYHNKEFALKMESVGLMPSTTGLPGGAKTGDKMGDYPIPDGAFINECTKLISAFKMPWFDRYTRSLKKMPDSVIEPLQNSSIDSETLNILTSSIESLENTEDLLHINEEPKKQTRAAYECEGCGIKMWGKNGLKVACITCGIELTNIDDIIDEKNENL